MSIREVGVARHTEAAPKGWNAATIALLFAAHVAVAYGAHLSRSFSTAHALATLGVSLLIVIFARRPQAAAYAVAYIAGAEVMWRMTRAEVFYEYGKYAVVLVLVVALLKNRLWPRMNLLAVGAFAALLPSIFMTIDADKSLSVIRDHVSSNLSGPLSLLLCIIYFSNVRLANEQRARLFIIGSTPVVAVLTLCYLGLANRTVTFGTSSNFAASGGFGPNQVSATLSLGAMLCFLYVVTERGRIIERTLLLVALLAFGTQSALTFSRGGVYMAVGSILAGGVFVFQVRRVRWAFAAAAALTMAAASFVIVPRLVAFTGGAVQGRFASTDTDARNLLIYDDLRIFAEHPVLGIGPGETSDEREGMLVGIAPHTEFTRLLAEHGIFGALSLFLLCVFGVALVVQARSPLDRTLAVALGTWAALYMLINAMRLVAPAFAVGLAAVGFAISAPRRSPSRIRRAELRDQRAEYASAGRV